jgi:hypothetical protein
MKDEAIPELLTSVLRRHFNVNGFERDWVETLHSELNWSGEPERAQLFRQQLATAILHNTITPEQYEELTEEDFDTQAELKQWLRDVWKKLYGNEDIT